MIKRVCDLCGKNYPDAKIKYKYRAKKKWYSWHESGWTKLELCENCLSKIVGADEIREIEIGVNGSLDDEYLNTLQEMIKESNNVNT